MPFCVINNDSAALPAAQMPHDEVSKKYGVARAQVKNLQESAGKFALMVAAFCECLGWNNLDLLISQFQVSFTNL